MTSERKIAPYELCFELYEEGERLMTTLAQSLQAGGRDPSLEELKVQIACYGRLTELAAEIVRVESDILHTLPTDMQKRLQERALRYSEHEDQIDKLESQLDPFGP